MKTHRNVRWSFGSFGARGFFGASLLGCAALLAVPGTVAADPPPGSAEVPVKATVKPANPPAALQLSPELTALRDHVRGVLAAYAQQPVNTQENTPNDLLKYCLAYGCDTQVRFGDGAAAPVSGVGCLCGNCILGGYQMLSLVDGQVIVRVGYAYQDHPFQLLATLALSRVPQTYGLRIGAHHGTVAELVQSEKLNCREGTNLACALTGLAFYAESGQEWKSRDGQTWSVSRLIEQELGRAVPIDRSDALDHLIGLSVAIERQQHAGRPLEGQFVRARKYVNDWQKYALSAQNPDGSWHPNFLAMRGATRDTIGHLFSTGYILEWLAFSLSADRLEDRGVVSALTYATGVLESSASRWSPNSTSPREIEAIGHALHGLRLYNERVFIPRDPKPEAGAKPAEKPAAAK